MCHHCGCREITPIRRLMAEHERLLDLTAELRSAGDGPAADRLATDLVELLTTHVRAEEHGLFTSLRDREEFADHIKALEAEHAELALALAPPVTAAGVLAVATTLTEHIHAEEYGIFPAALAELGRADWEAITTREAAVLP